MNKNLTTPVRLFFVGEYNSNTSEIQRDRIEALGKEQNLKSKETNKQQIYREKIPHFVDSYGEGELSRKVIEK